MIVLLKLFTLAVVVCLIVSGIFEIWELPNEW